MIQIDDSTTIGEAFFKAADLFGTNSLFAVPVNPARSYHPDGYEISYADAAGAVRVLMKIYAEAGYGPGQRIGLFLENRPEHILHKLALNALGVCCVPMNPDYRAGELVYVLEHSHVDLVIVLQARQAQLGEAISIASWQPPVVVCDSFTTTLPRSSRPHCSLTLTGETPASILYTSGTTGRPKGCVLSHRYELAAGAWYATRAGLASIHEQKDRLYNPLPLFHVNASILSFWCMVLTGNCQIQTDRFQPSRWWQEVRQSEATIIHYLGVVIPMLLNQPDSPLDRDHHVRFGLGAGVEPQLHEVFEQRFGLPLLEIWGMTEIVRAFVDNMPPRQVGTRAFGKSVTGLEARVVDDRDREVQDDVPGELVVRHSEATPRKDFFSCYLDDEQATEQAWTGGWFHTGDIVRRDPDGMLHFIDRRKHIIRRSGENIAAAEIEAMLLAHPLVKQVAVMPVMDDVREQEVLACIVLKDACDVAGLQGDFVYPCSHEQAGQQLFTYCMKNMAYYKAPGWIWFTDQIPMTGTQKIQKHRIFAPDVDPRSLQGMMDMRLLKKRDR